MTYDVIFRCTMCGATDSEIFTSDCMVCSECGTPEHFEEVEVDENGEEIEYAPTE